MSSTIDIYSTGKGEVDIDSELAEINAQIAAEEADNLRYFSSFLSELGVSNADTVFTQVGAKLTNDQL